MAAAFPDLWPRTPTTGGLGSLVILPARLVTFSGTILGRVQRTCHHRGAKSVGYDYPPDDSIRDRYLAPEREREASDVATHATFFPADVSVIEYLHNLHLLAKRVQLFALPLPVEGGDGAPARVIALQPKGYQACQTR